MSNGRRGKLVLQEVPSEQVEKKVVRLLLKFAKSASVEQLTQKVRRTPYTLSNDIEAEKAALIIGAFEKFGAMAAFVPHVPAEPVAELAAGQQRHEPRGLLRIRRARSPAHQHHRRLRHGHQPPARHRLLLAGG